MNKNQSPLGTGLSGLGLPVCLLILTFNSMGFAQPDPEWLPHDRTRPSPREVDPGQPSTQEKAGKAPSDAVVLFDGKDLSQWVAMDGSSSRWIVKDGYMECVKGSGYIRTLRNFGDCQLHVEWAAPLPAEGTGQGRGNSGVFFGGGRYEIQVLDSYKNKTYADGSAGSAYCQYPPLVNACLPPGQWQSYELIYTAPRFEADGSLKSPARITALHNGVLIQQDVELTGPTGWLGRPPYSQHPVKQFLALQDHGNPVRFRNIWVRELGKPGRPEYTLPDQLLRSYVGNYGRSGGTQAKVTQQGNQLVLDFSGTRFELFAESATRFFATSTDVVVDFEKTTAGRVKTITISVGEGGMRAEKVD